MVKTLPELPGLEVYQCTKTGLLCSDGVTNKDVVYNYLE